MKKFEVPGVSLAIHKDMKRPQKDVCHWNMGRCLQDCPSWSVKEEWEGARKHGQSHMRVGFTLDKSLYGSVTLGYPEVSHSNDARM